MRDVPQLHFSWIKDQMEKITSRAAADRATPRLSFAYTLEGFHAESSRSSEIHGIDFSYHERNHNRQFIQNRGTSWKKRFIRAEGWFYCAMVAVLTAFSAGWIEMAVKYLFDLRFGVCDSLIWLSRSACCDNDASVDLRNNRCVLRPVTELQADATMSEGGSVSLIPDRVQWLSWSRILRVPAGGVYWMEYIMYIVLSTVFAAVAAVLCQALAPPAAGSGIPEVKTILGGFVLKRVLGFWTLLIKVVGLAFAIASGLCLGKEGPLVHIACCWSHLLSRYGHKFRENEAKQRELLSAACATGVSCAFGAPLGGVLFSLEEVSTYFPPKTLWKSFFCAVVGALVLKWIDADHTGSLTMFQMDMMSLVGGWQLIELVPFTILGVLGGMGGALYIHLNVRWAAFKKELREKDTSNMALRIIRNPILEAAVVTCVFSVCNYNGELIRMSNSSLMKSLFNRCQLEASDHHGFCSNNLSLRTSEYNTSNTLMVTLFGIAALKFVQAVFCFGLGLPSGLFIPSLTIGALMGRMLGLFMLRYTAAFHPNYAAVHAINPGVYALVGAAAMLGGVTRTTISIVVIMFELTGGLNYVVPFMSAVMVSKWVGDALAPHSIYECYIRLRGYPFLDAELADAAYTLRATDIATANVAVFTLESNTVASMKSKLARYSFKGFPLVTNSVDRGVCGLLHTADLQAALAAVQDKGFADTTQIEFSTYSRRSRLADQKGELVKVSKQPPSGFNVPSFFSFVGLGSKRCEEVEMCTSHRSVGASGSPVVDMKGVTVYYRAADSFNPNSESKRALLGGQGTLDFSELVDEAVIQLVPESPLSQVHNLFHQLGIRLCLLTRKGRLEGLLTKRAFLSATSSAIDCAARMPS